MLKCTLVVAAQAVLVLPLVGQATWTSLAETPTARVAAAFCYDTNRNQLVVFGGGPSVGVPGTAETWEWDGTWHLRQPVGLTPPTRTMAATAFDAGRGVAVMAGGRGSSGNYLADTWLWNGAEWTQAAGLPGQLVGAKAVFDASQGEVVLFGGSTASNQFSNETLRWSGVGWTAGTAGASPSPRWAHQMAYDPLRQTVVLYGGADANVRWGDTWELAGATWTQRFPAVSPPTKSGGQATFDSRSGQVLVHSGYTTANGVTSTLADVWLWNGATWFEANPVAQTNARSQQVLASTGARTILWSGREGSVQPSDTWEWTGTDWVLLDSGPPSPRTGIAMAYDVHREQHVVFGGRRAIGAADLAETWELAGEHWQQRTQAIAPAARSDAGLVFDSARQRTVLFGGRVGGPCGNALGDTWEWDGQAWSLRSTPNSPPASGGIQLVFDSARQLIWALCGSQMWSYDGTNWTNSSGLRPSARGNFGCTYDTHREKLVMFGGTTNTGWLDETWEWDGSSWQLRASGYPSSRATLGMAYDPTRQLHFMQGGWNGSFRLGDAFTWNGTTWTQIPGLSARSDVVLAYDPRGPGVLAAGGYSTGSGWLSDMYAWSGSSWTPSAALISPRHWNGIAYDPARQRIVMFGGGGLNGSGQLAVFDDTWEFDGVQWTQVTPATRPVARGGHSMVFDSHTQEILMYGGTNHYSSPIHQDTWTWNGTTWTERFPQHNPGPRYEYGLVSTGTRTLLAYGASWLAVHNDIWEWNGTDWQPVESQDPAPRSSYGAAYDSVRDRVVVFGGRQQCGAGNFLNETWEWDGNSWQQRFPAHAPSPRERSSLAFDSSRNRILLFGGVDASTEFGDTWEWDGDDWTHMVPTTSPPTSSGHGLSFDQQRNVTVAFGERGTWQLAAEPPPIAIAGEDFSVNEVQGVVLNGGASTGPVGMTYAWTQTGGRPVSPLVGADAPQLSFTAPIVAVGGETLTFTLTVTAHGVASSDTVNVTVVNVNHIPVADAGDDQEVAAGAPVTLSGEDSFDVDNDIVSYAWVQVGGPTVALSDPTAAVTSFSAPFGPADANHLVATLVFQLTVDDGYPADAPAPGYLPTDNVQLVTVVVSQLNHDPIAVADLTFAKRGADADRDDAHENDGHHGEGSQNDEVRREGDRERRRRLRGNQHHQTRHTVPENSLVTLDGSDSSDPDGDTLTYSWAQTSGPAVVLSDAASVTPTFTAPFVSGNGEVMTFVLTVTDPYLGSDTDTITIRLRNVSNPPVAANGTPTTSVLWPPDHGRVVVGIRGVSDSRHGVTITITSVTQDEPTSGLGHGDTPVDAFIRPDGRVLLRAERDGDGNGRVYHIHFTASDLEGSSSAVVTVSVPRTKRSTAVDEGELFNSIQ